MARWQFFRHCLKQKGYPRLDKRIHFQFPKVGHTIDAIRCFDIIQGAIVCENVYLTMGRKPSMKSAVREYKIYKELPNFI